VLRPPEQDGTGASLPQAGSTAVRLRADRIAANRLKKEKLPRTEKLLPPGVTDAGTVRIE
jgi:hypothetical protein